MKLFILHREESDYDENEYMVVLAESEQDARRLASEAEDGYDYDWRTKPAIKRPLAPAWLTRATVEEIDLEVARVVHIDFHPG